MSLKAKLEAVTYAAEEPVTLAQLAALFATDALDWKAEREAASALDSLESTDQGTQTSENLPLLTGEFEELEHGQAATAASAVPASSEAAFTEQAPTDQTPREQGSEVEPDSAMKPMLPNLKTMPAPRLTPAASPVYATAKRVP